MRIIAIFFISLMLTNCAMIIPNSSKVKFTKVDPETKLSTISVKYKAADLPDEKYKEIGKGETTSKLRNNRPISVILAEQAGYKSKNFVMYKTKFNPLFIIDIPFGIVFLGLPFIEMVGKFHLKYDKTFELSPLTKLPNKTDKESFLLVNNIAIDMKKEDFTVATVSKPEYLINHKPFQSTNSNGNEMESVQNQTSSLIENANKYLTDWGYSSPEKKSKDIFYLDGKITKMEFMFYQGFVRVSMKCEWNVFNSISGTQVLKKEIISQSNYYKLFSAGYTEKSKDFDKTINESVDDVFEMSLIEFLNDEEYLKASSQLNEIMSAANIGSVIEIVKPTNVFNSLESASNAVALLKCDDQFASATLISSDGYAVTSLDLLTSPAKKNEIWFEDGSKSEFELVQSNPEFNLALIKIKTVPSKALTFSMNSKNTKELGDEIYLVSKNMNDTKLNGSTTKGMIASKYSKEGIDQFQIDISYNKWNDGSPVIDKEGKIIGISLSKIGTSKSTTATVISIAGLSKIFNLTIKE